MKIKTLEQIPEDKKFSFKGVKKDLIIGDYDGSNEIVLRMISIEKDCYMPVHSHDFPHIWKIEKGVGVLTHGEGKEHIVTAGQYIFVENNESHGMKNIGEERLEYLCFGTIESESCVPQMPNIKKEDKT